MKRSLSRRAFAQGSALALAGASSAMLTGYDSTSTGASGNAISDTAPAQNRGSQQNSPSAYLTHDISASSLVEA